MRPELRHAFHELVHRRIVDAMHDVEHHHVVLFGVSLDDVLCLLLEEPERDGRQRDAARRADRKRKKAVAPLHTFLRRTTNRSAIFAPHIFL